MKRSDRRGNQREMTVKNLLRMLIVGAAMAPVSQAEAPAGPGASRVNDRIIEMVRGYLATDIVQMSVADQNRRYSDRTEDEITELDAQWRKETEASKKPLISATLSNPLSAYLTRIQAHSNGLFTEIFVMDDKGMNVGQSTISSDYWQGDEDKWQKTFGEGKGSIFVDAAEYDDKLKAHVIQLSMSVDDKSGKPIGAATFQINLSELQRR